MRNYLQRLLLCLLLMTVWSGQLYSHDVSSVNTLTIHQILQNGDKQSLRSVLHALEEFYHVSFNYDDATVQNQYLNKFVWNGKEELDAVLKRLVDRIPLRFEKVNQRNYFLFSVKKKITLKDGDITRPFAQDFPSNRNG